MSERLARRAGSVVVSVATVVTLLALAIVPFVNPVWVSFAQARADAAAWAGFSQQELSHATGQILADLVTGGDFAIAMGSERLLAEREVAHMQDVQRLFAAFGVLALAAAVALVAMRRIGRTRWWTAVRRGAVALAAGTVAVGVAGLVAFELAFEVIHGLFFASGTWTFDPRTDRLVQLFPLRFWFETSIAVGAVALALGILVAVVATRRLRPPRETTAALAPRLETVR